MSRVEPMLKPSVFRTRADGHVGWAGEARI